ncbi:MAG TPA: hypothetical protein VIY49_00360 [Bryobacteraceae bacterium]
MEDAGAFRKAAIAVKSPGGTDKTRSRRPAPKGRVVTFYSYKGGTGRSMALANVAWLLAMSGERVLVIDWDLEAPGIYRYFHPLLEDKELLQTEGLLDFLEKLRTRAAMSSEPLKEDEIDIVEYITVLKWPPNCPVSWEQFGEFGGSLDLLVAGRQGPLYGERLNAFSFVDFYEKLGGRRLLEIARRQMQGLYDYVLIDSRTGVSDTSGICTVEMPDTLVVCFTLNDQSIIGASGVAQDVLRQRSALPPGRTLTIFPVPMRVEIGGEQAKLQIALAFSRKKFAPFIDHIPRAEWSRYWESVQISYLPFYAFEEIPAVFGDRFHQQVSLRAPTRQIARAIAADPSLDAAPLANTEDEAEKLRQEILGWYVRKPESGPLDPVQMAEAVYQQADADRRRLMQRVFLRLVIAGGPTPAPATAETSDLEEPLQPVARNLADSGILEISGNSVYIADRRVCERWERLGQWVKEDEAFLAWRQSITGGSKVWLQSNKDASGLLRGTFLTQALNWLAKRPNDLNPLEREFIEQSRPKSERKGAQVSFRLPGTSLKLEMPVRSLIVGLLVVLALSTWGSKLLELARRRFAPSGEYWTAQTSFTGVYLRSVFATADGQRLWIVGDSTTIWESSDGGQHWNPHLSGAQKYLYLFTGLNRG